MSTALGLTLIYGIPGLLSLPLWLGVRRLNQDWEARAFMNSVRAKPAAVHHSERLLGIKTRP